ncbi:MAG: Cyclopentanol dehydrogenase [Pelotomaculum sp. PtaB.Bin104]|nr:MAG: Cyclopentanol dehydrogenase [Pelotomaculum sp. PtaB.Bin104]
MDIKDKVVWVTGGVSGLGKAIVEVMLREGAKVMATDLQADKGSQLAKQYGGNFIFVKASNTVTSELQSAVETVIKKWGRIDVLVNSAGRGCMSPLITEKGPGPIDEFKAVIDLNLCAAYDTTRLAAWEMIKNEPNEHGEKGVVIQISSGAAAKIAVGMSNAYSASKAGILGFVKEAGVELGPHGIRIVAIQPGIFTTPLLDTPKMQPVRDLFVSRQTFPKKEGDPQLIGEFCLHIINNWFFNRTGLVCDAGYIG